MKLSYTAYPLQLKHTFTVAGFSRSETPDVLLSVTHEGITGYGEASMPPYLGESIQSVLAFLDKVDLSPFHDPFAMSDIHAYLDTLSPGDWAAKAAVDIALHDLQGKTAGMPLWKLWGLSPLSLRREGLPTTFTIGIDTPENVRAKTLEVAGQYHRLKVKVGVPGDKELIASIREVTDLPLTVDANQGWKSKEEALDEICWLRDQGVIMVEQPLPKGSLDALAWLSERSPLPVIADESCQHLSDLKRLRGCVTGINIKLMKCGGLWEARQMAIAARAFGMQVMLGCMTETVCAVSAIAHLASFAQWADLDGHLLIDNHPFAGGMEVVEGNIRLPSAPGIGIEPVAGFRIG
jgi:L-alanine-DL-glutamate epimerase-like enolase superfamily enzyme